MAKPLLLDAYCGAGGTTKGYQEAGFRVVGVDNQRQPRYCGDEFVQADALEYIAQHGHRFDAFHASPPCQLYSHETPPERRKNHPDLIAPTRDLLRTFGKPHVIENVYGARKHLIDPLMLCGTMFGLNLWRHRFFEVALFSPPKPPPCNHVGHPVLITGTTRRSAANGGRFEYNAQQCRDASGLHWMTRKEMDEAIPPAYTRYIGEFLMRHLQACKSSLLDSLFRQVAAYA